MIWNRALLYLLIVIITSLLVIVVCEIGEAQPSAARPFDGIVEYRFENPGLGGMVSNYDVGTLQPTQAFYLFNADVTGTPGRIKRRTAISDYGVNTTKLYGAFGYYNPLTGDKLVVGVTDHDTYGFGQFVVSDTFGTEVGYDTLGGTMFPYADVYHDFTPFGDVVVCADGYNVPCIFSTSQGFLYAQSRPDTLGYEPHLISMGLEAPGQLRVGILDVGDSGHLNGTYVYAVAFQSDSASSIESRPITVSNGSIYVTNLPMNKPIYILRKSGQDKSQWFRVHSDSISQSGYNFIDTGFAPEFDTVYTKVVKWWTGGDTTTLFDTLPSGQLGGYRSTNCYLSYTCCVSPNLGFYDSLGYRRSCDGYDLCLACWNYCWDAPVTITTDVDSFLIDSVYSLDPFEFNITGRRPGQFYLKDTLGAIDTTHASDPESLYYIAYSYYDLITGIESPLGPRLACSLTVAYIADSVKSNYFAFDEFDSTLNPGWIRVYQTVTKTTLAGASDSMVLYGLFEIRNLRAGIPFGQWNDDDVATGLDTSYLDIGQYYTYQMLRENGVVKVLPPYNYDCQIPFSDVEYIAGRFWGIGDPDYPNRVYYSSYYNIFSWYPLDFIQINEIGNDELVKIERAEGFGADALYLFAHNSVWLMDVTGQYQAINTRIGAASQETVVKYGDSVYFMSPNLRFHVLAGAQTVEISQPVDNYVESVFVDWDAYGYQGFYSWAHTFGDYVRWFNDTTGMGLSFNTKSGAWTLERYGSGAYVPRGSFSYDTMRSVGASVIMTSDVELLYMDSSVSLRKADPTAYYDVAGSGATNFLERAIQFVYWTPRFGDGVHDHQIQEFDLTFNVVSEGAFCYTIYNEDNDSLCGDSVTLLYSDTTVHLRIMPPYNNCLRPSLKIYSNDTDSLTTGGDDPQWVQYYHNFEIIAATIRIRGMGVGLAQ